LGVRISLTGRVSIEANGARLDERSFPGRQGRLVFAYLLAEEGRAVPRDELAEMLWGDAPPTRWEKALSVLVSKLRALLEECGVDGQEALRSAFGCYQLVLPPGAWIDLAAAREAADRTEAALSTGDTRVAREAAAEAAALARRSFLPGEDGLWIEEKRRELSELLVRALECAADACLAAGDTREAVRHAEELTALEPYREGGYRRLMQAHAAAGDNAEALRVYERCRRLLAEELGAYPSAETESVYRDLLRKPSGSDSSLAAPEPAASRRRIARTSRRLLLVVVVGAALVLAIVAALMAAARYSSGGSREPFLLAGDSVAVIDPETHTIVGEIPVGDRPTGPAIGEGSVWVGNRDDDTLLRIDPRSRDVVRTIGLGVKPTNVAVGAGSIWILSDWALLRFDPDINEVVARVRLPRRGGLGFPWTHIEVGENAIWVCSCATLDGALAHIDPDTNSIVFTREGPVGAIEYGEGALWALTGFELRTLEWIDPRTNAVIKRVPRERIGGAAATVNPRLIAVGDGVVWSASAEALWRMDPATGRFTGSVQLGHTPVSVTLADDAVWVANSDGVVLRVDPDSQTVAKTIPLGTLVYPVGAGATAGAGALAVGEGSVWVAVTSFAS
jgi:SARP family transcriptional regulator, regulator of embCAB operon